MKQHILLIDEDKKELGIFLDALKEVQVDDGFKCTYACAATKAQEMLRFLVPDFIFLDPNMPSMNALEFISLLKSERRLQQSKVYLYSTFINDRVNEKAILFGASGCVVKTDNIHKLSSKLKSVLATRPLPAYVFGADYF